MPQFEPGTRCVCKSCGAELRPGMLRCRRCGRPASDSHPEVEAEAEHWERLFSWRSCPNCDADVRDAMLRCRKCGVDLRATAEDNKSHGPHASNPFLLQSVRYEPPPRRPTELSRCLETAANAVRQMRSSDKPVLEELQQFADKLMTFVADGVVAFIERMVRRLR